MATKPFFKNNHDHKSHIFVTRFEKYLFVLTTKFIYGILRFCPLQAIPM